MVQENPPGNLNMATQSSPKKNPGNKENVSQEPSLHFARGLHVANMVSLEPVKGVSQRQRGILGAVSNPVQLNSSQDTVLAHKGNTTQIYTFFFKEMYWLMKPGRTGDAETQAMWHDNAVTHSVLSLRVFVCVCVSLCLSVLLLFFCKYGSLPPSEDKIHVAEMSANSSGLILFHHPREWLQRKEKTSSSTGMI